jgi:hypothetical protein
MFSLLTHNFASGHFLFNQKTLQRKPGCSMCFKPAYIALIKILETSLSPK